MFKPGDLVRIVVLDESDKDDHTDLVEKDGYIWTVIEYEPTPEPEEEGDYDLYLKSLATSRELCFYMLSDTLYVPETNLRLEKADV